MRTFSRGFLFCLFLLPLGCSDSGQPKKDMAMHAGNTPEAVYRRFFLALLDPDATAIRDLIVDNEKADILWSEGSYPDAVAAALATQYREMDIQRVESPASDRVVLQSTASPLLLTVVKQGDDWRVDAGPLIEMRHQATEIRQRSNDER